MLCTQSLRGCTQGVRRALSSPKDQHGGHFLTRNHLHRLAQLQCLDNLALGEIETTPDLHVRQLALLDEPVDRTRGRVEHLGQDVSSTSAMLSTVSRSFSYFARGLGHAA